MNKPIPTPRVCYLTKDKIYAYCTCNQSTTKPYCDESHQETTHTPLLFKVMENEKAFLCTCGNTKTPPYCDGSH